MSATPDNVVGEKDKAGASADHSDIPAPFEKTAADTVHDDPIFSDPDYRQKEKRMVRILDLTLLPMLWILYLFNYLDRTNVA